MILEGLVGAGIMFFGMTAGWVMNNVAHKTNNVSKQGTMGPMGPMGPRGRDFDER